MATSPSDKTDYVGLQPAAAGQGDFNAMSFVARQLLGKIGTICLLEVMAVTSAGEVAECVFIDVKPMQDQQDGAGNATPHGIIHDVPYFRMQGGSNAVIMDPQVGDIGLGVVCSRDISSTKATKKSGTPGSRRMFDLADAVYFGGILNGVPTQYIRFSANGIVLKPAAGKKVTVDGPLEVTGAAHVAGAVTGDGTAVFQGNVTGAGKSLNSHTHSGVTTGGGNTGPPT